MAAMVCGFPSVAASAGLLAVIAAANAPSFRRKARRPSPKLRTRIASIGTSAEKASIPRPRFLARGQCRASGKRGPAVGLFPTKSNTAGSNRGGLRAVDLGQCDPGARGENALEGDIRMRILPGALVLGGSIVLAACAATPAAPSDVVIQELLLRTDPAGAACSVMRQGAVVASVASTP